MSPRGAESTLIEKTERARERHERLWGKIDRFYPSNPDGSGAVPLTPSERTPVPQAPGRVSPRTAAGAERISIPVVSRSAAPTASAAPQSAAPPAAPQFAASSAASPQSTAQVAAVQPAFRVASAAKIFLIRS